MAECLITTSGTSGTFRLDFKVGSNSNTLFSNYDDEIYITDTATDVTYTRLSGDVTVSSGCVTITALPLNCYKLSWERLKGDNSTYISYFDRISVGSTNYDFDTPIDDKAAFAAQVANAINALNDPAIKATALKTTLLGSGYIQIDLIVRVMGSTAPELRIKSPNNDYSYIKGSSSADCVPTGYSPTLFCEDMQPST